MSNENVTQRECLKNHEPLMKQLEELKHDLKANSDSTTIVKEMVIALPKSLADEFDKRYASKKTERDVDKVIWLVVSAVIVAGLALMFK